MLRILIAAPFLLIMVLFALSNPVPTQFGLWPTDYTAQVPLSLAVLVAMGVAFILGAFLLWVTAIAARARARRAEYKLRLLEAQVSEMKAKLDRAEQRAAAVAQPALAHTGALVPVGR